MSDNDFVPAFLSMLVVLTIIYIAPAVVAFQRRHPNRWPILIVNIVFGGTGIGWFGALIWALHAAHLPSDPEASRGGESGLNLTVNDPVRLPQHQVAGPLAPEPSIAETVERLQRLEALLAKQAITAAEFRELKSELLRAI